MMNTTRYKDIIITFPVRDLDALSAAAAIESDWDTRARVTIHETVVVVEFYADEEKKPSWKKGAYGVDLVKEILKKYMIDYRIRKF